MLIPMLPVVSGRSPAAIPAADLSLLVPGEQETYSHCLFGPASGSINSIVGTNHLSLQDGAPTYQTNYATLTARDALLSTLADSDTQAFTACIAFRIASSVSGIKMLFGNLSNPIANGRAVYSSNGTLIFRTGDGANQNLTGMTAVADAWHWLAVGHDPDSATDSLIAYADGQALTFNYDSSSYVVGATNLAVGDSTYSSAGLTPVDYAEAVIFDSLLTADDLAGVYNRSKIRLGGRGITLTSL